MESDRNWRGDDCDRALTDGDVLGYNSSFAHFQKLDQSRKITAQLLHGWVSIAFSVRLIRVRSSIPFASPSQHVPLPPSPVQTPQRTSTFSQKNRLSLATHVEGPGPRIPRALHSAVPKHIYPFLKACWYAPFFGLHIWPISLPVSPSQTHHHHRPRPRPQPQPR